YAHHRHLPSFPTRRSSDLVLQARPETVHSNRKNQALRIYRLIGKGETLAQGLAVGEGIAVGRARVIASPSDFGRFQKGEILVTRSEEHTSELQSRENLVCR